MKGSRKYWVIALLCGMLTAFLSYQYLQNLKNRYSPDNLVPVVIAKEKITHDTVITESQLRVDYLPAQYVQPQSIDNKGMVVGKSSTVDIAGGEQILKPRLLSRTDKNERLSYAIPKSKRAVSVAVDNISGVGGYIQVGDRVDIVATLDIPLSDSAAQNTSTFSILKLQDIEVLRIGNSFDADAKKSASTGKTITLAVSVDEALPLVLASERGNLRLLLRSPLDKTRTNSVPYQLRDLLQASGQ